MLFPLQVNLLSTSSNIGLMPQKTTSREQHVDQILLPSTHLNYQSRLSLPASHFPASHPISLSHNHPSHKYPNIYPSHNHPSHKYLDIYPSHNHPSQKYPNIYPSHNHQHLRARRSLGTNLKVLSNLSPKERRWIRVPSKLLHIRHTCSNNVPIGLPSVVSIFPYITSRSFLWTLPTCTPPGSTGMTNWQDNSS